jgi:hypothetical protein
MVATAITAQAATAPHLNTGQEIHGAVERDPGRFSAVEMAADSASGADKNAISLQSVQ